jgi:hypothetical protein
VKINQKKPPRQYIVGMEEDIAISDCGTIALAPDEQITFVTEQGGEFDFTRKDWGFYASPSLNKRLPDFNLRPALIQNRNTKNIFILVLEKGHEESFQAYLDVEELNILCWLDDLDAVANISLLR